MKYWTRFLPSYPKVIIYMLQASGYSISDYLNWLKRVADFRRVEKRQELDYTIKAKLLLGFVWLEEILFIGFSLVLIIWFINLNALLPVILPITLMLLAPLFAAYGIIPILWLGQILVQEPHQRLIIDKAKKIIFENNSYRIAIAGSYGKTSAKEIIATVLSEAKTVASTPGNMNTAIGISRFIRSLTGKEDVTVFELGEEKPGDVAELCDLVMPEAGVITGINEAHLSSFGTLDKTVSTIFEIKDYLGDKTLYKYIESPLVRASVDNSDPFLYSKKGVNGWKVGDVAVDINGTSFKVAKGSKQINVKTKLLGEHHIGILCVAVDIADSLGLTIRQIEEGLSKTEPFEHRMKPMLIHGAWVIDDTYNGNSEGVKVGLELLKTLKAKRHVYVTPGLVEQGEKTKVVHENIGRLAGKVADVVILMNNSTTDFIVQGLKSAGFKGELKIIDDPLRFYSNLEHFVIEGDVVLMQNDWPDSYV